MKFLILEGAVIRNKETGDKDVVCLKCYRETEPVLLEEMTKEIESPVHCVRCGEEIKPFDLPDPTWGNIGL